MKNLEKVCKQCLNVFKKKLNVSIKAWANTEYCQRACAYKSRNTKVTVKCDYCGLEFLKIPKQVKKRNFCGCKCFGAANRGENNPSFGGVQWNEDRKKEWGSRVKQMFKDGRMDHMKEVWKAGEKRWTGKGNPRYIHGNKNGYKMVKIDGKWKEEHRVIMEEHMGRKLKKSEIVHHINHDKHDNRLENLQTMSISEHVSHHRKNH